MPIALSSLIVGDWKSLLSNLGGTGPDPTIGRSAEVVVLHVDEVVVLHVDAVVLEEVEGLTGSADTEGELEPGVQEVAGAVEDKTATLPDETGTVGADKSEALNCAFLACFLAAALVCHPHEYSMSVEDLKKDPLSALFDRGDRCADFLSGRFLTSDS